MWSNEGFPLIDFISLFLMFYDDFFLHYAKCLWFIFCEVSAIFVSLFFC